MQLSPFPEIPKFKRDFRKGTLHLASSPEGNSFILRVSECHTPDTDYNLLKTRIFTENNEYIDNATAKVLLQDFWIYQPVEFLLSTKAKKPKEGIVFDGKLYLDVWKMESEKTIKPIQVGVGYSTPGEEFDYIKPITLDWFFKNKDILIKYELLIDKGKEDADKYYDLREQLFNY